ncbi:sufE-like protein 1, chloroplastic/mitochondrial [Heracleum sosnowskyi]|uniref:SufE-like protein 1, chloroplastic/mitochondrial n=1 Tax=Heracleum sosnowskyi TaxID=360622 RepID=A0AAD8H8K0_9APIA|nr:sufE-like protein 1, chloroplastic/mitochondrial [Heracleum sosnowskyi]
MASFRVFSSRFPQSILHPAKTPLVKTLFLTTTPSQMTSKISFFRSISIQRVATTPHSSSSSTPSTSINLQPISDLPPKLQEIVKLFQSVEDSKAKYEQLLFYGRNLKPLDSRFKISDNKVQGCVSQVWVRAYFDDDKNVIFEADSDSVLTKGLAALLVQGLSGEPVEEIVRVSPDFAMLLGLQQSLTPSRNNGFLNMLKLMQKKALNLFIEADKSGSNETVVESVNSGSSSDRNGNLDAGDGFEVGGGDSGSSSGNVIALGSRGERIREMLERELKPDELKVEDISYQHAGHAGVRGSDGETHFNVRVVSKEFEGKSLVKRHRLVYGLLQDELQSGLHALSIEAKTPSEVGSSS